MPFPPIRVVTEMLGNVLSLKDEDDLSVDEDEQVSPCINNRCAPKPVNVRRALYASRINTETLQMSQLTKN